MLYTAPPKSLKRGSGRLPSGVVHVLFLHHIIFYRVVSSRTTINSKIRARPRNAINCRDRGRRVWFNKWTAGFSGCAWSLALSTWRDEFRWHIISACQAFQTKHFKRRQKSRTHSRQKVTVSPKRELFDDRKWPYDRNSSYRGSVSCKLYRMIFPSEENLNSAHLKILAWSEQISMSGAAIYCSLMEHGY